MTEISSAQKSGGLLLKVPPNTGEILPIYQCGIDPKTVAQKEDPDFVAISGFVSNLRCVSTIDSLPEAELPDIEVEDSDSQRQIKALDAAWKNPRRQIDLLFSLNAVDWEQIGSVPLLNPMGYPFATQELLSLYTGDDYFEMPDGAAIAIRVARVQGEYVDEETGNTVIYDGYLDTKDKVTIWGSWIEEISFKSTGTSIVSGGGGGGSNVIETAGLMGLKIIEKTDDARLLGELQLGESRSENNNHNTGTNFYSPGEVGCPRGKIGLITVGYWVLGRSLRISCRGNYGPQHLPDARRIQLLDAWDMKVLLDVRAVDIMPDGYNAAANGAHINIGKIDTSAYAGRTAALRIINDAIGEDYHFPLSVICPSIMVEDSQ